MKKIILKIIMFFIILFLLLLLCSYAFIPKNNSEEAGMENEDQMGILAEEENTVDIIMYGDSETIASTIPMNIWEEYGYTMHICGYPGQALLETIKILPKTLEHQNPKVVILESNNFFDEFIKIIVVSVVKTLTIIEYHNRWKNIKIDEFFSKIEYKRTVANKGYHYIGVIKEADDSNYMISSDAVTPIPKANQLYINIIKKYCENRGIKLVIASVPSCKNWSYEKHNGVKQFADENNIEFLDMNELKDELNIDWKTETGDNGDHVNYYGAVKTTKCLGKWLNQMNILENHKNDEKYKKWNNDLEEFKKSIL